MDGTGEIRNQPIKVITHEEGFAYFAKTTLHEHDLKACRASAVMLEDGVPLLGPGGASLMEIREIGLGRFALRGNEIYFSTTDNSDPRTNGRTYTVRYTSIQKISLQRIWNWLGAHLWSIRNRISLQRMWRQLRTYLWTVRSRISFWGAWYWICFAYVLSCDSSQEQAYLSDDFQ